MDTSADASALMFGFKDDLEECEGAVSVFMGERGISQWWLDGCPPACCSGQGDSVGETYGFLVNVGDNSAEPRHSGVSFDSLTVPFHRPKRLIDFVSECLTVEIDDNISDRAKFATHVVVQYYVGFGGCHGVVGFVCQANWLYWAFQSRTTEAVFHLLSSLCIRSSRLTR